MTDEQIKQNAGKYASFGSGAFQTKEEYTQLRDAFIAGAHSRDEEIKELKEEIESLQEQYNTCFDGFAKRGTKLGELMKENVKLRNPWISIEDRLPEKTRNLSPFPDEYEEKVVLVINKQGGKRLAYRDYKGVWRDDYTCEIINQNYARITHWMPIPETPLNK